MGRIHGLILNITDDFIIVEDVETKTHYNVPKSQIVKSVKVNDCLVFERQYNLINKRHYIVLERDDYKLFEFYDFEIIGKEEKVVRDSLMTFLIVRDSCGYEYSIKAFKWQQANSWDKKIVRCKVIGYNREKLKLLNVDTSHPYYSIGNRYSFKVVNFSSNQDEGNQVHVIDSDLNEYIIKAFVWQNENIWKFEDVICEVRGFDKDGLLILINKDNRHPVYEIKKEYNFKVIGSKQVEDSNDRSKVWNIIVLEGEDGITYQTTAFPGQIQNLKLSDSLRCEVVNIDHRLKLKQVHQSDPFFISIQDIIKDKSQQKYAKRALDSSDSFCEIFKDQYNSKRSFWILTFCNKILPTYLRENLDLRNFSETVKISDLLIQLENYIINSSFLDSFTDENYKHQTSYKAHKRLNEYSIVKECSQLIANYDQSTFPSQLPLLNLNQLIFLIQYCEDEILIRHNIVVYVIRILQTLDQSIGNNYENILERLDKTLSYKKRLFYNNNQYIDIIAKIDSIFKNKEDQQIYFQWTYCQFLINVIVKNVARSSYLAAKILRLNFFVTEDYNKKQQLIFNAYYLLTHDGKMNPEIFSIHENDLILDYNIIESNPNVIENSRKSWWDIKKSNNENSSLLLTVQKRHYDGFEVSYQGIIGFLPVHHITDPRLKAYTFPLIDFTISAKCILYSEEFSFFVVKQVDKNEPEYLSINNLFIVPTKGQVTYGYVKNIAKYGLFISTQYGDGLLHISQLPEGYYWDEEALKSTFQIGDKLYTVIFNYDESCGKMQLSLKALIDTEYEAYYKEFLNKLDFPDFYDDSKDIAIDNESNEKFNQHVQMERAYCFEQYALFQIDVDQKIKYLRIAKQFFSTINNARSYLINIYNEYFEWTKLLDSISQKNYAESLNEIKQQALELKKRIHPQTMDNFPEVKKLYDFLEVIIHFNETSDFDLNNLLDLINTEDRTVRTIVKITLANNLMLSEIKEAADFSLKNLKLLKTYLNEGILTLQETQSEKHERELREKVNYWRSKMLENESESLEFKSTFKTPILDKSNIDKLKIIEGKLSKTPDNQALLREKDKIVGLLAQKAIIHSSLKTLAAFANTKGGTLLIGITDNQTIIGLETDYKTQRENNRDGFGKFFDDKIREYFDESFSTLLEREFIKFPEGDILAVTVKASPDPVFLLKDKEGNNSEQLYVRELTTTKEISQKRELAKFVQIRFQQQIKSKINE